MIDIKGKTYRIVIDYKDDVQLRASFNQLTQRTYGFDFEEWYQNGYWTNRYIPYSLADGADIISNVSVNFMDFIVDGKKRSCLQIGTVMTDMAFRKQGLNKILMNRVLDDWRDKSDLIYLFANNTVLDFYPKFGFTPVNEHLHSMQISPEQSISPDYSKLDMSKRENRDLLSEKISQTSYYSEITMINNAPLIMFYCTSFMSDNVYFIKKYDAIVIADFKADTLILNDIFCSKEISLKEIILSLVSKEVKKVVLGFSPMDKTGFKEEILIQDDTLFVLNDKRDVIKNKKRRFPVLSHA